MLNHKRPGAAWPRWLAGAVLLLAAGLLMTWISNRFAGLAGWLSFTGVLLLGAALLGGGWFLARKTERQSLPSRLLLLVAGAVALRLAAGILWYLALPAVGHNTPAEQAGYVMSDALNRDKTAWKLANSGKPLLKAFGGYPKADQYGGMLWISAALYRYLGGPVHQPLRMVVITAVFSALSVLLAWLFLRRVAGGSPPDPSPRLAWAAAWGVAVYPEAILLGSSQMREAFTMTLVMAAFYGLAVLHQDRLTGRAAWPGLAWIVSSTILFWLLSPPFAAFLVILLAVSALGLERRIIADRLAHSQHSRLAAFLAAAILLVAVVAGSGLALRKFSPPGMQNPLAQLQYWLRKSADQQAYLSERASGKLQALFERVPSWLEMPALVGYGVLQPFLPAALVVTSEAPIWQYIAIWRSAGWMVVLAFLGYGLVRSFRSTASWTRLLAVCAWATLLAASYRGGGDQWDNPRYRATFLGLQIGLAALVWAEQRATRDPWFGRLLVALAWVVAWFVPYYLQRQYHIGWPITDLFKTFGMGLACSVLFFLWDWARQGSGRMEHD